MLQNFIIDTKWNCKNDFQNSFKLCKISTFNLFFLGSMILHKSSTAAFADKHTFGLEQE